MTEYFTAGVRVKKVPGGTAELQTSPELSLSRGAADAQCVAGWPLPPCNEGDSESCSVQPQRAGVCAPAAAGSCTKTADCWVTGTPQLPPRSARNFLWQVGFKVGAASANAAIAVGPNAQPFVVDGAGRIFTSER
jgi:hypothetical protein